MTLTQPDLYQIKSSEAEAWHGPNSDTDEGSDKRISRSYGQIENYGQKRVALPQISLVMIWVVLPPVGKKDCCIQKVLLKPYLQLPECAR